MTTWFVTRHQGAVQWASEEGLSFDRLEPHLDPSDVSPGDVVIGTLPIHLAAAVCERGARYLHLSMDVASVQRGNELAPKDMRGGSARIEEFHVERVPKV